MYIHRNKCGEFDRCVQLFWTRKSSGKCIQDRKCVLHVKCVETSLSPINICRITPTLCRGVRRKAFRLDILVTVLLPECSEEWIMSKTVIENLQCRACISLKVVVDCGMLTDGRTGRLTYRSVEDVWNISASSCREHDDNYLFSQFPCTRSPCFTPFCINALFRYTQLLNLRCLICGLTPFFLLCFITPTPCLWCEYQFLFI